MLQHNWLMWQSLFWLLSSFLLLVVIDAQSQNAVGAHRSFQKTSFSCVGRPAGYYADVETGCQIYHMCDGLGRQFSYSCPNTTLFQQRMLICDHWYMVNCSRAESDYAANLLIGQRDKPFVNDEENNLRTPRPDLLDRPYAPDYSGESFRNQYKQFPAAQNQIQNTDLQKNQQKLDFSAQLAPGQQRWKIPPPSRTILPPAYEASPSEETTSSNNNAVHFVPHTTAQPTSYPTQSTSSRMAHIVTSTAPPTNNRHLPINHINRAALHQRPQQQSIHEQFLEQHDDLGTSHSTRYNTSADFNSPEATIVKQSSIFAQTKNNRNTSSMSTTTPSITTTTTTKATFVQSQSTLSAGHTFNSASSSTQETPIKIPSKIYEPPFLYPIYNENDTFVTDTPLRASSATPFTSSPARSIILTTTPITLPQRPTTLAGKPFSIQKASTPTTTPPPSPSSTSTSAANFGRNQNNLIQPSHSHQRNKDGRTPTPAQGFKPPTPRPPVSATKPPVTTDQSIVNYSIPATPFTNNTSFIDSNDNDLPAKQLLPPFQEFFEHDIATTQGPPIYYEWKIPSNGLEPPKLDPPIGVDGREYSDAVADYNSISASSIEQKSSSNKNNNNSNSTTRIPISRSIKETGQPNSVVRFNADKATKPLAITTTTNSPYALDASSGASSDITKLRKDLSVPDYAFPLEPIGRTGYLSTDTYNSFQLKIPERRSDEAADAHQHWFGENPQCPECHPSFVVPGTCEPCLRR